MQRDDFMATLCIILFVVVIAFFTSGCAALSGFDRSYSLSYEEGGRTVSAGVNFRALPAPLPSTGGFTK